MEKLTNFEMMSPAEFKRTLTCYKCFGRFQTPSFEERVKSGKIKRVFIEDGNTDFVYSFHDSCLKDYLRYNPSKEVIDIGRGRLRMIERHELPDHKCHECGGLIKRDDVRSGIDKGKIVRVRIGSDWKHFHTKCLLELIKD